MAPTATSLGYEGAGDFVMDPDGRLERRGERAVAPFIYAGVAILTPGLFADTPEGAFSLNSAAQLGVRHTRRLGGLARIERKDWGDGTPVADEVGISPSISPKFPVVSVPYGCLVPRGLDGLLAAGRHISCDANSHGFMREIPQCWLTGHAAGVGAAVAANRGVQPREVDVTEVRAVLRQQGAHLSDDAAVAAAGTAEAAE